MNQYDHKVLMLMAAYFGAGSGARTPVMVGGLPGPRKEDEQAIRERNAWNKDVDARKRAKGKRR